MSSPPSHVRSGLTADGPTVEQYGPADAEVVAPEYDGPPLVVAVTGAASGIEIGRAHV